MTSPKQRKKGLAILRAREQAAAQIVVVEDKPVEVAPAPVVESAPAAKPKKTKTALVELKSQDQVVEQTKEEVKSSPGE